MKKENIIIGCIIIISISLIIAGIARVFAIKSIGGYYFKPNSVTELVSLVLWVGGIAVDIVLIIITFKLRN